MGPKVKVCHLRAIINGSFDLLSLPRGTGVGEEGMASYVFYVPWDLMSLHPPPILHSCWARPKTELQCWLFQVGDLGLVSPSGSVSSSVSGHSNCTSSNVAMRLVRSFSSLENMAVVFNACPPHRIQGLQPE